MKLPLAPKRRHAEPAATRPALGPERVLRLSRKVVSILLDERARDKLTYNSETRIYVGLRDCPGEGLGASRSYDSRQWAEG
jgi:hypothetical protein